MKVYLVVIAVLCGPAQEERTGTAEQNLHYRIAPKYNQPEAVDQALESAARSASGFGPRYAAMMVRIHRTFGKGTGFQDLYQALLAESTTGGPKGAPAHYAALAAGVKKAVFCPKCENGKVKCPHCQGSKKYDMKCPKCDGKGYFHAKGEVKPTVLQRCNTCNSNGIIKDTVCNLCSVAGYVDCTECKGSPWHQEACPSPECRGGRVVCPNCQGKGTSKETCPDCGGKRRTLAPGASAAFKVTVKCRTCDGEGSTKIDCPKCNKLGKLICDICKGKPESMKTAASLGDVLSATSCTACGGQGWPEAGKAFPCPRCLGLGVIVVPASDTSKILIPE
jgi:DnaJ-class molecular chaperone